MEVKKATSIRSMEYEDFKNNDYLEEMVRRLNMDGAGIVLGTVDELINWGRFALESDFRNQLLCHRIYGAWRSTL